MTTLRAKRTLASEPAPTALISTRPSAHRTTGQPNPNEVDLGPDDPHHRRRHPRRRRGRCQHLPDHGPRLRCPADLHRPGVPDQRHREDHGIGNVDWGFLSFTLITRDGAEGIAGGAADSTYIAPLGAFYRDVMLPNWGFFGVFLTLAELAVGLGLIFGVATRLAAVGGLLPIAPIYVMLWHTGLYLWEYPAEDLMPLALLATIPAGRIAGLDARLAPRYHHRWPF